MRKISGMSFALLLIWLIIGCSAPRPLTFEEQEAWMARRQCEQEATNFNPFFPGPDNADWSAYYVMCMRSLGIGDIAIRRMWP